MDNIEEGKAEEVLENEDLPKNPVDSEEGGDDDFDFEDTDGSDADIEGEEIEEEVEDDEELELEFDGEDLSYEPEPEKTDEPEGEPEVKADNAEELSLEDLTKQIIKEHGDPSYIPGTKEFFKASAADAKAEVEKELGEEFDQFDPDHISSFNFHVQKAQAERQQEYQQAIEIVKKQREAKTTEAQRQKKVQELKAQIESILPTPELQKSFDSVIDNMSKNSRGEYLLLMEELSHGKTDRFIKLAKRITGPHKEVLDKNRRPAASSARKSGRELVGSDILGF